MLGQTNFRAQKVDVHKFTMIPDSQIPRSTFRMESQHKTTFPASQLIPIFVQEALPGDTWNLSMTAFVRMTTPIVPIMDNMDLESWFFFVPNRIIWTHWVNFMGEQPQSPSDSTSYTIPTVTFTALTTSSYGLLPDYMGLPTTQIAAAAGTATQPMNALPFRAYNLIWNQWFRDQNFQTAANFGAAGTVYDFGDGPDLQTNYIVQGVNKRHDYFTSCLPWTQKNPNAGGQSISFLTGSATVKTSNTQLYNPGAGNPLLMYQASNTAAAVPASLLIGTGTTAGSADYGTNAITAPTGHGWLPGNLFADLTTATTATINTLRLAFQTQKLLERDARGGTRYTEILRSHFGVTSPDARLQRPEYLGGGKQAVNITPVPQTSATGLTGGTTPAGSLSGVGTTIAHNHGFKYSATEHGYLLGLVAVRKDNTYQQGTHRLWTRSTRYDFYWPVFSHLGEQAVRNDEILTLGNAAGTNDAGVFGYQERYGEYRFQPSRTSGLFRSTAASPIDYWHLGEKYAVGTYPVLNGSFISDDTNLMLERCTALGAAGIQQQFLGDFFFSAKVARPMPMYGVPGLIDHF